MTTLTATRNFHGRTRSEAAAESVQTPAGKQAGDPPETKQDAGTSGAAPTPDALLQLVDAGRNLLNALAESLAGRTSQPAATRSVSPVRVEQDPATGEQYVRVAMPSQEKLKGILDAVAGLLRQ